MRPEGPLSQTPATAPAQSDGQGPANVAAGAPIAFGEPDVRHHEPANGIPGPTPPPLRILIVDDNHDAADSLGMLLRVLGNEVRIAYDGLEALRIAADFRPAAILLDIGLPGMNGYEVARALRQHAHGEGALLIATTGWSQPSNEEHSRQAGFDHHLVKPVDPGALTQLLRTVQPA